MSSSVSVAASSPWLPVAPSSAAVLAARYSCTAWRSCSVSSSDQGPSFLASPCLQHREGNDRLG